jgi:hypothetical protein
VLTAACAIIALALLTFAAVTGYGIGHARKLHTGEDYNAGQADGIRIGLVKGEHLRDALQAEVTRLVAALDELGRQYDRLLAQQGAPRIARTVEDATGQAALVGDDTLAVFGGDDR